MGTIVERNQSTVEVQGETESLGTVIEGQGGGGGGGGGGRGYIVVFISFFFPHTLAFFSCFKKVHLISC